MDGKPEIERDDYVRGTCFRFPVRMELVEKAAKYLPDIFGVPRLNTVTFPEEQKLLRSGSCTGAAGRILETHLGLTAGWWLRYSKGSWGESRYGFLPGADITTNS